MVRIFPEEDWTPPQPASNDELWRYIDFTQFISILENERLWFSPAAGFFDPFEGALPPDKLQEIADGLRDEIDSPEQLVFRMYDALRRATFVSCWHQRSDETASMWQLYQNKGKEVALKTTVADFRSAVGNSLEITSGLVKYEDYTDPGNFTVNRVSPFFYKRPSFEYEREFRAVVSDFSVPDGSPVNEEFADRMAGKMPPGKQISVAPSRLINEIYISPVAGEWLEKLVPGVLATYGLDDIEVQSSELREDPFR